MNADGGGSVETDRGGILSVPTVVFGRQRVQCWQPNSPSRVNNPAIPRPHMAAVLLPDFPLLFIYLVLTVRSNTVCKVWSVEQSVDVWTWYRPFVNDKIEITQCYLWCDVFTADCSISAGWDEWKYQNATGNVNITLMWYYNEYFEVLDLMMYTRGIQL